ncbi:hypothetical protein ACI2K6_09730 [Microbacterium sp. NPDC006705]|uniref:hypothetical protein n=1 Tax=Microbacterium TaxID=33882 RepID=UPI00249E4FAC|nr:MULTISPECIES: hypothetical protein [Microbacterium]WHE36065.1 hypothetical protein P6897_15440 [Microbacterium sp. BDGP8]WRK17344.1 hypothetical protein VC184_15840 [Microbacterium plantarum]
MNDNERTPQDQPIPADAPTLPLSPSDAAPADAPSAAPAAGPAAVPAEPRRRGRRTALLAGGAVVAAALLVGGGAAVGAAIADDDDDEDRAASLSSSDGLAGARADGDRDDAPTGGEAGSISTEAYGAASADELTAIADAARAAADGDVVSLDADRDGTWDVQLVAADGSETDVRVDVDGIVTVTATESAEADDTAAENVLDVATLRTVIEAALSEADGRIIDVDADDDPRSPFDVSVLTADRGVVDVTVGTDGSVLRTELDD